MFLSYKAGNKEELGQIPIKRYIPTTEDRSLKKKKVKCDSVQRHASHRPQTDKATVPDSPVHHTVFAVCLTNYCNTSVINHFNDSYS